MTRLGPYNEGTALVARGGGSGGITSTDDSIVITGSDATLPGTIYVAAPRGSGLDDAAHIQSAINAVFALGGGIVKLRPTASGVFYKLSSKVSGKTGVRIMGAGRRATTVLIDVAFLGHAFEFLNINSCGISDMSFGVTGGTARTAGSAIHISGGDTTIQFPGGIFSLAASECLVERVDMDSMWDGVVIDDSSGANANWISYVRDCRIFNSHHDGIVIDCGGSGPPNYSFGASQFIDDCYLLQNNGTVGNAQLHVKGSGDWHITKTEVGQANYGLLVDCGANTRCSTGRLTDVVFDTSVINTCLIAPAASCIYGDIDFNGCWFAGAATSHGMLINSPSASDTRFRGCTFYLNSNYGAVVTGSGTGPRNVTFDACNFANNVLGGVRFVNCTHCAVRNSVTQGGAIGNPSMFDTGAAEPQADGITVDLGCTSYIITGNDNSRNQANAIIDNGGAVTKVVANNL